MFGEGKDDFKPSEMTPDQKATVSNIVSLGAAGLTAGAGGSAGDVVSSSQLASSAVENNRHMSRAEVAELKRVTPEAGKWIRDKLKREARLSNSEIDKLNDDDIFGYLMIAGLTNVSEYWQKYYSDHGQINRDNIFLAAKEYLSANYSPGKVNARGFYQDGVTDSLFGSKYFNDLGSSKTDANNLGMFYSTVQSDKLVRNAYLAAGLPIEPPANASAEEWAQYRAVKSEYDKQGWPVSRSRRVWFADQW